MEPYSLYWLFVLGIIVAFADGFGIGANDTANSFATSVGSRSLTLKQACGIAVITEFSGAVLFGSKTVETIREDILRVELFSDKPEILMLGMVCALFGSATWVIFATSKGLPVSTTHSIVGAIVGIGVVTHGLEAVDWTYSGILKIVTTWLVSPIVSGVLASIIFLATKFLVLVHQETSFQRGLVAVPVYFGITIAINVVYLIVDGVKSLNLDKVPAQIIGPIVVGITLVTSAFSYFFYAQWLRRKILGKERELKWYHMFVIPFIGPRYREGGGESGTGQSSSLTDKESINSSSQDEFSDENIEAKKKKHFLSALFTKIRDTLHHGVEQEVADFEAEENREMHEAATKYDRDTEQLYSFLQILTGSFASFSHGSNDVSNSIGPLSTIYLIYKTGSVQAAATEDVPILLLALGGAAIDVGLLFYGYHVMRSLGNKFTYHSPSRGFSMELGTSLTVLTASKTGLPVSTTYCITGATAGVALCNGKIKALNWKLLAWCFFSWVLTVPASAAVAGSLFAFASYSPKMAP